jgi:hypothetical protein
MGLGLTEWSPFEHLIVAMLDEEFSTFDGIRRYGYRIHKTSPLDPALNQINPARTLNHLFLRSVIILSLYLYLDIFISLSHSVTFSLLTHENAAALTQPKYAGMYVG